MKSFKTILFAFLAIISLVSMNSCSKGGEATPKKVFPEICSGKYRILHNIPDLYIDFLEVGEFLNGVASYRQYQTQYGGGPISFDLHGTMKESVVGGIKKLTITFSDGSGSIETIVSNESENGFDQTVNHQDGTHSFYEWRKDQ